MEIGAHFGPVRTGRPKCAGGRARTSRRLLCPTLRSHVALGPALAVLGLSLCLIRPGVGFAQPALSLGDDPRADALIRRGLPLSYNLQYRPARKIWDELIRLHPGQPAGYVYRASLLWWQAVEDRKNEILEKQFKAAIDTAIDRGRARLQRDPEDVSALAYLGSAYALAARFDATVKGSFFSAMRNGLRGHRHAEAAYRIDPSFPDPLIELGAHDYFAAAVPAVIKPFAWLLGARGQKTRGIERLLFAARQSRYARTEARIVLLSVYYSEERWEDYDQTLESLMREYPLNHVFHMWAANSAIERKRLEAGLSALRNAEGRIEPAEDEYVAGTRAWLNFHQARIRCAGQDWAGSLEALARAEETGSRNVALLAQLYLLRGNALDVLGRREEALSAYARVQDFPDVDGSHSKSRRYIRTAYRGVPAR